MLESKAMTLRAGDAALMNKSIGSDFSAHQSNSNESSPVEDRRPKRRQRSLLAGIVTYSNGAHSFMCTVRNVSEVGARVSVPQGATLPFLIIVRQRIACEASVTWRSRGEAGLKFERSITLGQDIDPKLAYLNKLWHGSAIRVGGFD
jgi:hypothetical protein